ncbi:MAG TPA: hypothetical protein VMB75_06365 [Rhodocyclaceae bacterium]|nr:hypothetical protein [Rhodocyclaceae bacterium]
MRRRIIPTAFCLTASLLLSGGALADKPSWAGGGRGDDRQAERHDRDAGRDGEDRGRGGHEQHGSARFDSGARHVLDDYYGHRPHGAKCPPGLAKQHNGCLPPGQAKKWAMGRPLPADLRYYELPRDLLGRLPPPPPQHRYVQVAGDILMIAVGSNMVVDAIEDIVR